MQTSHNYSVLWGLAAFSIVGVLILVLRWAYSDKRDSLLSRRPRRGGEHDYGLLAPIAAPKDDAEGELICALLRDAGIRGTNVPTNAGLRVMVWPQDETRARQLLLGRPPG